MRHNNRRSLFPIPVKLTVASTLANLEQIVATANHELIRSNIYKGIRRISGAKVQEVREALREMYYSKCAYCENTENKPEVEHYRPKKRVTNDSTHPGYYWLCYEWTNLLPACHNCNAENGKCDQFPVRGIRVVAPSLTSGNNLDRSHCLLNQLPLTAEQPSLLHPEVDHPENGYFRFASNGMMEGIDQQRRGEETIAICDLNRQNLIELRQEFIIDNLLEALFGISFFLYDEAILENYLTFVFGRLKEKRSPEKKFSLMAIYVYDHFDQLIIPLMPTPEQGIAISTAFANFKAAHPD